LNPQGAHRLHFGQRKAFLLQLLQTLSRSFYSHLPPPKKRLSSLLLSRPPAWSRDRSPSLGAATWPTTLEEPGRKLHQATVLFHCTARPPQLALCCADRRQSAPGRPHQESTPNPTLRDGGRDMLCVGEGQPSKSQKPKGGGSQNAQWGAWSSLVRSEEFALANALPNISGDSCPLKSPSLLSPPKTMIKPVPA
jgi:hypothetical protein